MRRTVATLAMLLLLTVCVPASEFDWLVREFSRESGVKPMHIPFFWMARFAVAVARPAGTSELKLAVFEHADLDAKRFSEITDSVVGSVWKPIVRVRSRKGESTNIYAQSDGQKLRLLITTIDHEDATFVQVRIRPDELIQFVDEHRGWRE